MRSVVDRNVVMRRISVVHAFTAGLIDKRSRNSILRLTLGMYGKYNDTLNRRKETPVHTGRKVIKACKNVQF